MKIKLFWLLGLVAVLTQPAPADEQLPMLQAGWDYYTNVTVTTVTPTDIYFTHSQGMGNAKLKTLSPEMQKKFGFNPNKSLDVVKQPAEANIKSQEVMAAQARSKASSSKSTGSPAVGGAEPIAPKISAKSFRGAQAPSFVVEKWITPKPDMVGKFVLLDFWATWCPPCRGSIPHLNELQAKFKDQVVVVGLSDEPEADIRRMVNPRIDYALAFDTLARTMREVQVKGIPHAILIDPKGIVRFEGMPHYLTERGLKVLLERYGN